MHIYNLDKWRHMHPPPVDTSGAERRTRWVIGLTLITMAVEIVAGWRYGSMALLADGWHMSTHAAALGIAVFAYRHARRHAENPVYSFGTGKVGVLGGYTSAIVLVLVALVMAVESVERFWSPAVIRFDEAILVAVVGLGVNLVSAWMLHGGGHHHHHDGRRHEHHHSGQDHNLRAAYAHVLTDALTSLLAIVALVAGKYFGWVRLDPVMGIVGAVVILRWAWGLLADTSRVLLDRDVPPAMVADIGRTIEADADNRVVDLHVWKIGEGQLAAIVSLVTHFPQSPDHYKVLLAEFPQVIHLTVEVNTCTASPCIHKAP